MLELLQLRKTYGHVTALADCSLTVRPGRVAGFLGPNGSGKTTAIRCVFGLATPDGGEVRWRGEPVRSADRLRFGYMPEQRGLYPRMGVHEQLVYFGRLHGVDAKRAQQAATGWLERLGLGERTEAKLEELSHGNQQRVQLAAALLHEPELVVLDEPFSGLDPIAVQVLTRVVADEAKRGAAVVFSSHQLDLVEDICEDVSIIHNGRIVMSGELQELRAESPVRFVDIGVEGVAAEDWVPRLEGVEIVDATAGNSRLRVPAGLRADALLTAAYGAGSVTHFRFEPPTLTQMFIEAVER